jgi:glutamate N-acetyltransferase/amino-acid N-acetyltransferase
VVNSGNANACTGARGLADARRTAALAAGHLKVREAEVLVASTGKIGEYLPMSKIQRGVIRAVRTLGRGARADGAVSSAILTTDTHPKVSAVRFEVGGAQATLAGITKGAGMIAPRMATMLCFLTTDVAVEAPVLQKLLREAVDASYNRISIDGHTSTNDTCICLANGAAGNRPVRPGTRAYNLLKAALGRVTLELAHMVLRDGEGVSKFVEVVVKGAASKADALKVARAVAESPLVKTAIHGEDPNWGRFTSAAGYSGARLEEAKLSCWVGDVLVFRKGLPVKGAREKAHAEMTGSDVRITLDLGLGRAETTLWTADLSEAYIRINAQYS